MGKQQGPPIDRGWAWVIVLGVALKSFINGGFMKSYGVFFSAFLDVFGRSVTETQLIKTTRGITSTLSAPFGTALSERFTERTIVMAGALVISSGFILCFFADSLEFVIFTFGITTGLGRAMVNGPSKVCVGRYFEKKRGRANSLSMVGGSIGQIVMPPFISILLDVYTFRGAMLIYGAINLNILITGALLRPLKSYGPIPQADSNLETQEGTELELAERETSETRTVGSCDTDSSIRKRSKSESKIVTCDNYDGNIMSGKVQISTTESNELIHDQCSREISETNATRMSPITQNTLVKADDTEYLEHSVPAKSGEDGCPDKHAEPVVHKNKPHFCVHFIDFFKNIFDKKLLTNRLYPLFLVSTSCFMIAGGNQTTFLVPRAQEYGISRETAAVLLSIIGGCDVVGRLVLGYIADIKRLRPHQVMAIGVAISSIPAFVLPSTSNFTGMAVCAVMTGLLGSSQSIPRLSVFVDFFGKELLAKAIGLSMFFNGVISAGVSPILGLIRDKVGTYDTVYYVTGSMQVFGAILLLCLEPPARRHEARKGKHTGSITTDQTIEITAAPV